MVPLAGSRRGARQAPRFVSTILEGVAVCDRRPRRGGMVMKVKVFDRHGKLVGPVDVVKVVKSDEEWKRQLTPTQYAIARGKGTERAFCGTLLDNKRDGVYVCVCCSLPLFTSGDKFDSGTGW